MAPKSQAGQKRPSEGANIRTSFTPGAGQAQPESGSESDAEPAPKRTKVDASTAEASDLSDKADGPSVSQAGWNQSIGTGLRTSFNNKSTKFEAQETQADADTKSSSSPEPQVDQADDTKSSSSPEPQVDQADDTKSSPSPEPQVDQVDDTKSSPSPEPQVDQADDTKSSPSLEPQVHQALANKKSPKGKPTSDEGSIVLNGWIIPKSASTGRFTKKPEIKKGESWEKRLGTWYSAVAAANAGKEGLTDPAVFLDIWAQWLRKQAMLSAHLRDQALKFTSVGSLGAGRINAMIANVAQSRASEKTDSPEQDASKEPVKSTAGWTLPPVIGVADFEMPMKEEGPWLDKFTSWLEQFVKLNKDITAPGMDTEKSIALAYREWIIIHKLSKNKTTLACKIADMAFRNQRERLNQIVPLAERPTVAKPPAEVIMLSSSSSSSEGEISEEDATWTPPRVLREIGERRSPGPLLFRSERRPADRRPMLPPLPVIPRVVEPIKLMSDEEELAYRAVYYPSVQPGDVFCLNCVNYGHITRECPSLTCRWCGVWGHSYLRCPKRHRCGKCRDIGHETGSCKSEVILRNVQMDCARCGAKDHLENACYEIFRSPLNPPPERIRKVKALPIYCGMCAEEGHYWTECTVNRVWWIKEVDKDGLNAATVMKNYVDPDSENVAVCYDNASSRHRIRGKAAPAADGGGRPAHLNGKSIVPQRHVEYFEEDDDDDENEQFIRYPPQNRQPPAPRKNTFSSFSSSNNTPLGGGRHNTGHGSNGNGNGTESGQSVSHGAPSGPKKTRARQERRRGARAHRGGRGGH